MKFNAAACVLVLLSLANGPALAAWYQVEVIVFANLDADADGELWPDNPGLPDRGNAIELILEQDQFDAGPAQPAAGSATPELVAYQALPRSAFHLGGVFAALRGSREYRPLLHVSWNQPGAGRGARGVYVDQFLIDTAGKGEVTGQAGLAELPQSTVEGSIRLRVTRFLHVEVDMAWFPPRRQDAAAAATPVADYARLRETRKIKLNQLHYFDHPLFGVVLQVSRVQPEG